MQHENKPIRVLRLKQVVERTGICRASIYRFVREGKFPASIKLGERAVGWYESDVEGWLIARTSNASVVR